MSQVPSDFTDNPRPSSDFAMSSIANVPKSIGGSSSSRGKSSDVIKIAERDTLKRHKGEIKLKESASVFPSSSQPNSSSDLSYHRRPKPPFSYIALIAMAIRASPSGMATLSEINDYLRAKFAFFRGEYTGWRNSVRHNLSLNDCFRKILRDPSRPWGKDNYWTLHETDDFTFCDGVFQRRRRRATARAKKEDGTTTKSGILSLEDTVLVTPSGTGDKDEETCRSSSRAYNPFTIDNLLKTESPCTSQIIGKGNSKSRTNTNSFIPSRQISLTVPFTGESWTPTSSKPKRQMTAEMQLYQPQQDLKQNFSESFAGIPPFSAHLPAGSSLLSHRRQTSTFTCPYLARYQLDPDVSYLYTPYHFVTTPYHLPCHIAATYHLDD